MIKRSDKAQRRGLLINITGNGKGKTTSALGACMRALGWGWQVAVIQFVKDSRETGEKRFAASVSGLEMIQAGLGMTWESGHKPSRHVHAALTAWKKVREYLSEGTVDLLVLDEFNIVLDQKWLDTAEVIEVLRQRPEWMHVIITGRGAPAKLINASDLVSEIKEIKHSFHDDIKAQKGIEY